MACSPRCSCCSTTAERGLPPSPPRRALPLLLPLLAAAAPTARAAAELSLDALQRTIDLAGSVARTTTTFTVKNGGDEPAASVLVAVDSARRLGYLSFEEAGSGAALGSRLAEGGGRPGFDLYAVELAVPAGGSAELLAYTAAIGAVQPRPAELPQGQPQHVEYTEHLLVPSPYPIASQSTEVVLPSAKPPRHYTQLEPTALDGALITYGPYTDKPPWAEAEPLRLNYQNSAPFFAVRSLTRYAEVSLWAGRLSVEDRYEDLTHTGALLKPGTGW